MYSRALVVLDYGLAALVVGCATPHAVSTRTLLAEMTALTKLAEFPEPPYTCRQASSRDRKSTTPADAETWFADDDYNQFLRVEERDGRKEWVMLDADSPGASVRIWSANPKGNIRIFLTSRWLGWSPGHPPGAGQAAPRRQQLRRRRRHAETWRPACPARAAAGSAGFPNRLARPAHLIITCSVTQYQTAGHAVNSALVRICPQISQISQIKSESSACIGETRRRS
jgi:hypothetical protein